MRGPIIDTTRTVSISSDTVEFDGIERTIWLIVVRCPVDGPSVHPEYFATREEAQAALNEIFA